MKNVVSTMKEPNYKRFQESAGHEETGFHMQTTHMPG